MDKTQTRRGFMLASFTLPASLSAWRTQLFADQPGAAKAKLPAQGRLIRIETSGSGYDVGRQYGERLQQLLKRWVDSRLSEVKKDYRPA